MNDIKTDNYTDEFFESINDHANCMDEAKKHGKENELLQAEKDITHAWELFKAGWSTEAKEIFLRIVSEFSEFPSCSYFKEDLAEFLSAQQEWDEAVPLLEEITKNNSADSKLHRLLGVGYTKTNQLNKAIEVLCEYCKAIGNGKIDTYAEQLLSLNFFTRFENKSNKLFQTSDSVSVEELSTEVNLDLKFAIRHGYRSIVHIDTLTNDYLENFDRMCRTLDQLAAGELQKLGIPLSFNRLQYSVTGNAVGDLPTEIKRTEFKCKQPIGSLYVAAHIGECDSARKIVYSILYKSEKHHEIDYDIDGIINELQKTVVGAIKYIYEASNDTSPKVILLQDNESIFDELYSFAHEMYQSGLSTTSINILKQCLKIPALSEGRQLKLKNLCNQVIQQ